MREEKTMNAPAERTELRRNGGRIGKGSALGFVVLIGIISLLADMTYEGARSINGPFLALLGAGGTVVGLVAGSGELVGYVLRLASGVISDKTGRYWAITIGAVLGPSIVVGVFSWRGDSRSGYAILLVPAVAALAVLRAALFRYRSGEVNPRPESV